MKKYKNSKSFIQSTIIVQFEHHLMLYSYQVGHFPGIVGVVIGQQAYLNTQYTQKLRVFLCLLDTF